MARESAEVFGVCGAACLMPKRVFDELGGFDEDFFASHEDVDLSYRARLLGYRCRYVADAVVRHHGSATIGRVSGFAIFHGQRNLEWLYVKDTPMSLLLTHTARPPDLHGRCLRALCSRRSARSVPQGEAGGSGRDAGGASKAPAGAANTTGGRGGASATARDSMAVDQAS